MAERGFRRAELFRWVRGTPVRTADGHRVPSAFDRIARRAGVAGGPGGLDEWHLRLDRLVADREAWRPPPLPPTPPAANTPPAADGIDPVDLPAPPPDRLLVDIERLRAFVDHLAALARPPAETTWVATASWLAEVLDRLVGGRAAIAAGRRAWPVAELDAYDEVLAVIGDLAGLDAMEPRADRARVLRVLRQELDRPVQAVGTFGHGVFVGSLHDLAGARHELVFVLGMAEGRFPPRPTDPILIPDADRRAVGGALDRARHDRTDEARMLSAALAAAPYRHLSFARVDASVQREATPARAFLRELSAVRGQPTGFDELDDVRHPAFVDVPSFVAGALGADQPLCAQERRVAGLLGGHETFGDLAGGIDAVAARSRRSFSRWSGDVGPHEALRFAGERVGSPTSFEQWATCPFRYFLNHVLRVRPYDRHADAESIAGRDRGSLVHEALERFVAERIDADPGQPWTEADHEHMRAVVREVAAGYESAGRTGRPLLWQAELDRLVRRLERVLEADSTERVRAGVHPVAVELGFGSDESPPVAFVTGSGRQVAFRGMIDRVDRDSGTGRLVVVDYKTGRDDGYGPIARDITDSGRHLQLVIYGEAARRHFGGDDVEAYFWFVEQGVSGKRLGGVIGDAERTRFGEVLDVIVDGIEQGRFPANPGEADFFFGFEHCSYCDYQRVCPPGRDDLWEGVQLSPKLDAYRRLAGPTADGGR